MKNDTSTELINRQIVEKQGQIKVLKAEIKILRRLLRPLPKLERRTGKPIDWRSSLVGWHNPKKHKGLTAEEFYQHYIDRLGKKKHSLHKQLYVWVVDNRPTVLTFIENTFSKTLSHPTKP